MSGKRRRLATLENIRNGNGATSWSDVESLLLWLGAERYERTGSRVLFTLHGALLSVHRVHGHRECGMRLVARVRSFLSQAGVL